MDLLAKNDKDELILNRSTRRTLTRLFSSHELCTSQTYYIIKVNSFNDIAKGLLDEWIYFLKNSEIKEKFATRILKYSETIEEIMKESGLSREEIKNIKL